MQIYAKYTVHQLMLLQCGSIATQHEGVNSMPLAPEISSKRQDVSSLLGMHSKQISSSFCY